MNNETTYILGISAFYHDSAACLLRDGEIVAAAQEERFTRKKGDASFPEHARDAETVLDLADKAMYLGKSQGRNKVCSANELSRPISLAKPSL